jgi:hypothetical protein
VLLLLQLLLRVHLQHCSQSMAATAAVLQTVHLAT